MWAIEVDQNTSHSVSLKLPALPHMQRLFFKYSNLDS